MDDTKHQGDTVLYHYCGAESFLSIIQKKSIWLSGISLANDTMEGRIVADTLMRLADRSDLTIEQRSHLQDAVVVVGQVFEGLAFCLSRAADQLSQWRGYAQDGIGYSIGFSRSYLAKLVENYRDGDTTAQIGDVVYEATEHERLAEPAFTSLAKLVKADELTFGFRFGGLLNYPLPPLEQVKRDTEFNKARLRLLVTAAGELRPLQLLKQSGFYEEQEVRLITMATPSQDERIQFGVRGQDLVPYLPLDLATISDVSPIREVWIGPRNRTPTHLVQAALIRSGFVDVPVYRSATTYR